METTTIDEKANKARSITAAVRFSDTLNARPIQDIRSAVSFGGTRYGENYMEAEMRQETAALIVKTTEFRSLAVIHGFAKPESEDFREAAMQHFDALLHQFTGVYAAKFNHALPIGVIMLRPTEGHLPLMLFGL